MAGNAQIEMDQSRAPSLGAELDQPNVCKEEAVDLSTTTVMQAVEAATAAQSNIEKTPQQEQNSSLNMEMVAEQYEQHVERVCRDMGITAEGSLHEMQEAMQLCGQLECAAVSNDVLSNLGTPVTELAPAVEAAVGVHA